MYYETYFGLNEPPFSISPDPRYLYLTKGHREALAHLLYGVTGGGGFVLLTGEVGAGKTTVCRCLLQQLPEDVDVALVLNPKLDVLEFLEAICDELGIEIYGEHDVSFKYLIDHIYRYLLVAHSKGRNTVLIVDEAQNLAPEVIEHLRLLTNLETDEKKLLQIILIGQPELRGLLDSPALLQMAQRITARFHLNVLSRSEAQGYIAHRLGVAGSERQLFDNKSIKYIWKRSGGVPRLINAICDRALLGASIANKNKVSSKVAKKAAGEVLGEGVNQSSERPGNRSLRFAGLTLCLLALVIVAVMSLSKAIEIPSVGQWRGLFSGAQVSEAQNAPGRDVRQPLVALTVSTLAPDSVLASESRLRANEAGDGGSQRTPAVGADLEALLKAGSDTGASSAYHHLFAQWGQAYDSQQALNPCQYAKTVGLVCSIGAGNLQTLVTLDRPLVLTLGSAGRFYKVTLISLREDKARVKVFGDDLAVPVDTLLALWAGEYLVLWRPPESYRTVVRLGARGDVVNWIVERLSVSVGHTAGVYDNTVAKAVRLFQQTHGLVADGDVGPLTMIALNNLGGSSAPRLMASSTQNLLGSQSPELSVATEE